MALKYYTLNSITFLNKKLVYFGVNKDMLFLATAYTTDLFYSVFITPSLLIYYLSSL
jgi:hypothetical protein